MTQSYLLKAVWPATSLKLRVEAVDEDDAIRKAENLVKEMEGCNTCLSIELMRS